MWDGDTRVLQNLLGGTGEIHLKGNSISSKVLKNYSKKKKLKKVYLLSCRGAKSTKKKESVAKALYHLTGKKAKIYASKVKVSFSSVYTKNKTVFTPRYQLKYIAKHPSAFGKNPIKRRKFW